MTDSERTAPRTQGWWVDHLHYCLHAQGHTFRNLEARMWRLGTCLAALNPDAYGQLENGLWLKRSSLQELRRVVGESAIPYPGTEQRIYHAADSNMPPVEALDLLLSSRNAPGESLNLKQPLTPEAIAAIRSYLTDHQPERRLAEIRENLRLLREALERHFTLRDILVSLSESSFRLDQLGL